jgi:hypothetical protein
MVTIDGSVGNQAGTNTITVSLTTTKTNDIIIAIGEYSNAGTSPTISSPHLTWFTRGPGAVHSGTNGTWGIEFYALASTPLSAEQITFSATSAVTIGLAVFGINGTAEIFDTNSGLPFVNNALSGTLTISGVSTNAAQTVLVSLVAESGTGQGTAPTGFTLINTSGNSRLAAAYKVVTVAQSNITVSWPTADGSWVLFVDAVQTSTNVVSQPNQPRHRPQGLTNRPHIPQVATS